MKLFITAKPGAKQRLVEKIDQTHFVVRVPEKPDKGRANAAMIKALADFLSVAPSRLQIIAGHTIKQKVIDYSE